MYQHTALAFLLHNILSRVNGLLLPTPELSTGTNRGRSESCPWRQQLQEKRARDQLIGLRWAEQSFAAVPLRVVQHAAHCVMAMIFGPRIISGRLRAAEKMSANVHITRAPSRYQ